MDESFGKEAVEKLFDHLNKKFVKLELSKNDFENELKSINYPTKYCISLYNLLFEKQGFDRNELNINIISNHNIFSNKLNLLSTFVEFDEDNNGSISHDEFRKALSKQGFSNEEITEMFSKMDEDGNGDISFNEFIEFFEDQVAAEAQKQKEKEQATQDEVFTLGFDEFKDNENNNNVNNLNNNNLNINSVRNNNNLLSVRSGMSARSSRSARSANETSSQMGSSPYSNDDSNFNFNPCVKDEELEQLLLKFDNNEMKFSDNLDASDKEILSSLIEMISNLAKDRKIHQTNIDELTLNNETVSQECEFEKTQNLRLKQEIEILQEQLIDLKQEIEQQKLNNEENYRIVRAATDLTDLQDLETEINANDVTNDISSNNDANNIKPSLKKRRSSLLNDKEIKYLTDEINKKQLAFEKINIEFEKKENEMKRLESEMGKLSKLEKENSEYQQNMTKLTNKFEKDIKKLNKANKKMQEENDRMKEYIDNLELDLQTTKQRHTEEVHRLSVQVNNAQDSKLLGGGTPGHSRNDTAVGFKRRMKTMHLNDVFDNVDGGIASLFDDAATDNEANANDPAFDDPFLNAAPMNDDLQQNIIDLENENDELFKEIQKQKTDIEQMSNDLNESKLEIERLNTEIETINSTKNETFLSEKDQKQGKMTVGDESDDEKDDNLENMQKEERIDINPQNNNTSNSGSFCAWICCGIKIV